MKKFKFNTIRHLLIRSANWVGDAVMTTPTIRAIRKNFPDADISILAKPWVAPVFYHNPYIDHILIYDAGGRHKGLQGKIRLGRDLHEKKFDLAILLQNAFEAALLAWLGKIPNRLGYDTDARTLLLTHRIRLKPERKKVHQIDYYLGILKDASLKTDGRDMELFISDTERHYANNTLKNFSITETDLCIGINPGAAYGSAKRWFPERYAAVCSRLQDAFDCKIIVFGGPGEESLGDQICEIVGKNCFNLSGKTSLRQAMALIETCRLFITNDSGLMHVAAALDVPQIAIFGPTNQTTTSPAGFNSRMISVPTPCSPCLKPECPEKHHNCMKNISVDRVYDAAELVIGH